MCLSIYAYLYIHKCLSIYLSIYLYIYVKILSLVSNGASKALLHSDTLVYEAFSYYFMSFEGAAARRHSRTSSFRPATRA